MDREQRDKIFLEKSRRMNEPHIISLEVCIEKLYLDKISTETIFQNTDKVKVRVKFGDFPCMEIPGTYEEEYVTLEAASTRTLQGVTSMGDMLSEREFFQRGRTSVSQLKLQKSSKKESLKETSNESAKFSKRSLIGAQNEWQVDSNVNKDDDIKNQATEQLNKAKKIEGYLEIEPREIDPETKITVGAAKEGVPTEGDPKSESIDNAEQPSVQDSEMSQCRLIVKVDTGIPFNDCRALIIAITPKHLLHLLITKPLEIFLYYGINENSVILIGKTSLSLYHLSDVVPHMISIEGGTNSVSKLAGTYPLCGQIGENQQEIGQMKIKIRIATYGLSCGSKICTFEPTLYNMKFTSDEWVEDQEIQIIPQMERDVSNRTAIVTGEEHTPNVEIIPDNYKEKPKTSLKCINKWKTVNPY